MGHSKKGFCQKCWSEAAKRQMRGDSRARVYIYYDVLLENDPKRKTLKPEGRK